jgi:hypothetical protein
MPYQGTSRINAHVSVECENCGSIYSYEHTLHGFSQEWTKARAMGKAQAVLEDEIGRIRAGKFDFVAEHRPCPKCRYVQSWMLEPVRRHRAWGWGIGLGCGTYLVTIPAMFYAMSLFPVNISSPLSNCLGMFLIFGLPVIVLFVVRARVRATYQPNKDQGAPCQAKTPTVEFQPLSSK